jgi:hypothetical protein
MMDADIDDNRAKTINAISGAPEAYRKFMMNNFDTLRKFQGLESEEVHRVEDQIRVAFLAKDVKLLKEIIASEGKIVAMVLAISRKMWENQKRLWQELNQSQKQIDVLDMEIARIEELARGYQLTLPTL